MYLRALKCLPAVVILLATTCWSNGVYAQSTVQFSNEVNLNSFETAVLDVSLKGPDGQPVLVAAVVTLLKLSNEVSKQETAKGGHVLFNGIAATEYSVQVVAAGYETTVRKVETRQNEVKSLTIELQKLSVEDAAENLAYHALAPKAQKEIGKARELLLAQKVADARNHLDAANRAAPNQGEVQYLYGVYEKQAGNAEQAKAYWLKAVEYSPKHLLALISLADALLRENRETEALPYATRAVEVEPASWRGHMVLANVYLRGGSLDEAVKEAERAMELGHDQAAMVQVVLAAALARKGEKERANAVLQSYLKEHPSDGDAKKLQEELQKVSTGEGTAGAGSLTAEELSISTSAATALPSNLRHTKRVEGNANGEAEFVPVGPKEQQKAQLDLVKAFKLVGPLLSSSPEQKELARNHLEKAYKIGPRDADVNYVFGAYWWQTGDRERAKSFWKKAIEYEPKNYRALLSLGQALLDEHKADEALPYLERAAQAKPFSWRTYALSADAYLRQGLSDQAVKQAERALELGHEEAALAQRYLAAALAKLGEKDKAVGVLQTYIRNHRDDISAKKQLEKLQATEEQNAQGAADAANEELLQSEAVALFTPVPLLSTAWLPPDVDERVPPVEQGATCAPEEVVQRAGKQAQAFVKNVERFTASEFLNHESIDKWGMAGPLETRKFDYVVAIEEIRPGFLGVEEFRGNHSSAAEFPDGVATNGLPALMLIFHPYNAVNFEMTCEGLARWNGKLAWQVHFRQRPDKPNTMRAYRLGMEGPSYPVALKGRAWILADSFQVARLETDLIAPVPEIKLLADRTAIEYGPVRFQKRNVEMWLPQSAEVFYDWRGKRIHRRHSFGNYLLFAVDEKQRISEPKVETQNQPEN